MNKKLYIAESFDMGGSSCIKRASKTVDDREVAEVFNDMYEMLEECKSILEGNTYFVKAEKIEQLLKRARGE